MTTKPLRSNAPAHSILSAAFDYKSSAQTDLAATFKRVRREQEAQRVASNVTKLRKGKQA